MLERFTGRIHLVTKLREKGYCFIRTPGRPQIFCHASQLKSSGIDPYTVIDDECISYSVDYSHDDRGQAVELARVSETARLAELPVADRSEKY